LSRQMLWRMLGADHPMDAHRVDSRGVLFTGASPDAREGVLAFLQKRPAEFPGKVSTDLPDIFG
ncbi:MAG: enoyl-CoA hydratase, partial [Actinobacteria bacterium]|nr:enoyl-CoA hydratase [Actinomycetota bacterium]MBV9933321.1 enoyl-CoA hydratase [Actinomycetota bacterium]